MHSSALSRVIRCGLSLSMIRLAGLGVTHLLIPMCHAGLGRSSHAIVEEDNTAIEATLGDQVQAKSNFRGQYRLAAADEDRCQEQLAPVDEPSPERLSSQV